MHLESTSIKLYNRKLGVKKIVSPLKHFIIQKKIKFNDQMCRKKKS